MAYKMRFVQCFHKRDEKSFLELEKLFGLLEENTPEMKNGRRFVPLIGREPTNTLIWEAEFESLESAMLTLKSIEGNHEHDALLDKQTPYIRDAFVEIYRELEL